MRFTVPNYKCETVESKIQILRWIRFERRGDFWCQKGEWIGGNKIQQVNVIKFQTH
ncbi:hypothetical protein SLEP1_g49781 [Rubroshorea leprosula]|uniref:Uncharacterized protein n=1 Tax=Rubroshorea leprosula TaxID=152421 RepID=A0AAV5LY25_9ROSI|nr:hypothetical protein SLEP1_g49781 [Rubroshorea leprosula]